MNTTSPRGKPILESPDVFPAGEPVGILGGGQLARMLAEPALRMGLAPLVLVEEAGSPAARLGAPHIVGRLDDPRALRSLFERTPLVIFENEFVGCDVIRSAAAGLETRFLPSLEAIEVFQDKILQKETLERLGIPSANFVAHEAGEDPCVWARRALAQWGGRAVFKWGRMGYDGKGVFLAKEPEDQARAESFCLEAVARNLRLYAEEMVSFRREVAIIGCRSVTGELTSYPLVISEQDRGICSRVIGPVSTAGAQVSLDAAARTIVRRIAEGAGLHGCFGIELFETEDERLLVNEIAPRVHNTGHYTQDACPTSQFENHLRAVLGLPLGSTRACGAFAMLNLLGPEGVRMDRSRVKLPAPSPRVHLHWYDKSEVTPRRKVGHLNAVADDPNELPGLLEELSRCHTAWVRALREL